MAPTIVFSFITVILLHIGSVNHCMCMETEVTLLNTGPQSNIFDKCINNENDLNSVSLSSPYHCYIWSSLSSPASSSASSNVNLSSSMFYMPRCLNYKQFKFSGRKWSPANVELFHALTKITILVFLKIIIKYCVRGYLKAKLTNRTLFIIVDMISKSFTIAVAKIAIKWALYPALRTAAKTLLITSIRSLVKPFINPLIKGPKGMSLTRMESSIKFILKLFFKVIIKTVALEMLVVVFENEATQMPLHQLMLRVALILSVKMSAKRICKLNRTPKSKNKDGDDPTATATAPIDKIMQFAIEKLITKLVKIPLIKILL